MRVQEKLQDWFALGINAGLPFTIRLEVHEEIRAGIGVPLPNRDKNAASLSVKGFVIKVA